MVNTTGCEVKLGPGDLRDIIGGLVNVNDPRLMIGIEGFDDAAVIKLQDDLALVFTVDIIAPVVDDPFAWGGIAAANALSDIYAMGGSPLCATNISCFPCSLSSHEKREVLAGGQAKAIEAKCMVVGGHTLVDNSPKYGMAVIGTVHPDNVISNRGAQVGDLIYISKLLGTGVVAQAIKAGMISDEIISEATKDMLLINREVSEAAIKAGVRAMTDVTGFGLIGHLFEMLGTGKNLKAVINTSLLPILPGVVSLLEKGVLTGVYRMKSFFGKHVKVEAGVSPEYEFLCYYPQTSGGLLCILPQDKAEIFEAESARRNVLVSQIGVIEHGEGIVLCL